MIQHLSTGSSTSRHDTHGSLHGYTLNLCLRSAMFDPWVEQTDCDRDNFDVTAYNHYERYHHYTVGLKGRGGYKSTKVT